MTDEEEKIKKYLYDGFSNSLILISISSQKYPKTILRYAKQLQKIMN